MTKDTRVSDRESDADADADVDGRQADIEDVADAAESDNADEAAVGDVAEIEVVDEKVESVESLPRPRSPQRRLLVPVLLVLALMMSVGVASFSYFAFQRSDQATDDAVATTVLRAASDGTVALLSYSPDTLDQDFAAAKSRLTGDFLNYYTQFTSEVVTPAAKQKAVKTSAQVVRAAIGQLSPTSATVLLFINQATTSKENPDGSFTASSVKVEMTKIGDDWLISKFDPV